MVERALEAGVDVSYVLMDNWFTYGPLLKDIVARGLHAIGMVKATSQRYEISDRKVNLQSLYQQARPVQSSRQEVLRSITTKMAPGICVKVVSVRHRGSKKD